VNGEGGTGVVRFDVGVGKGVILDAAGSRDPDGHKLIYRWIHYPEAGFEPGAHLAAITLAGADTPKATVTATAAARPNWLAGGAQPGATGVAHVILAVTDDGSPPLTSYRRIILTVRPAPIAGK
jgi:hypothetical protein